MSAGSQRWAAAGACLATLFVAFTAFRLAYNGSRGAAIDAGLTASDASWYPLCIEGVLVVAAIGTVVLGGRLPWVVLLAFSALSVGANVIHAQDQGRGGWFSLLVAAVPPAALPLCVELTIRTVRKLADRRADRQDREPYDDGLPLTTRNGDALLAAGELVAADLAARGEALTRSSLVSGLRARDVQIGTNRASVLLRQLRTRRGTGQTRTGPGQDRDMTEVGP